MAIGPRVRERRAALGLSQEQLAREAGLSWAAIQRLEAGKIVDPHYSTLSGIAHALGTTVAELMGEQPASVPLDEASGGVAADAPRGIALPSTPVTDTSEEDLDSWLKTTESAAEIDKRLTAVEAEARALEEFYPRRIVPKLDRARLYRAAILHRWLQVADKQRYLPSNRFKAVSEIAKELGGRYTSEESRKNLVDEASKHSA